MPEKVDDSQTANLDTTLSLNEKISDVGKLIDRVKVGMFTTVRDDGYLVSRPMHAAKRENADLFLVTNKESHKVDEIKHDAHVNMAFYDEKTFEWLSLSGKNQLSTDKNLVHELYRDDLRAWFGDKGDGVHDGGPNDPRIAILKVQAHSVTSSIQDRSRDQVEKSIHKAAETGNVAEVSSLREISADELAKLH